MTDKKVVVKITTKSGLRVEGEFVERKSNTFEGESVGLINGMAIKTHCIEQILFFCEKIACYFTFFFGSFTCIAFVPCKVCPS